MKQKHFCDVCGKGTENPFHFSTITNRHVHICETCFEDHRLDRFLISLDRLKDPLVERGLQLQMGKTYVRTDGVLAGPMMVGGSVDFPFLDPRARIEYTPSGTAWRGTTSYLDLVREFTPE